jgi:hypothetical protein
MPGAALLGPEFLAKLGKRKAATCLAVLARAVGLVRAVVVVTAVPTGLL